MRRRLQVAAVRRRLAPPARTVWRTTVQANDGTQFRFDSTFALHAGEFVEAQRDGTLQLAYPLSSNRIVGVVVACEVQL